MFDKQSDDAVVYFGGVAAHAVVSSQQLVL